MYQSAIRLTLFRAVAIFAALVTAMFALVALDVGMKRNHASAASTAGGPITRSEVLTRAQNWVSRNVQYNLTRRSNTLVTDVDGSHRYGPDCSGLVSMAWHITANSGKGGNSTSDFAGWSGKRYLSSLHDLRPGDAILKDGHMELFARWKNSADHSQGAWTYSLNGGADPDGDGWQNDWAKGPSTNSHGQVGSESWSSMQDYRPIRYNNIVEDGGAGGDFSGDGNADVLARNATTKDLHLYRGNGSGGFASGTGENISNNWSAFDTIFSPGDFNGDGKTDILARNATTKDLHLYRGNGSGGFASGTGENISNNWSAFDTIFSPGDFNGDGNADILARNATTKDLHLYRGNGSGGFASGTGENISNNWSAFDTIFSPGDFNGDGNADILARNATTKDLHLYRGNGSGGFASGTGENISNNWSAFDTIFSPGDFNGDGKTDILARNATTKDLHLYRGNGTGGFASGTGENISNNWSAFDVIF
ncbi:FG-GAP repeat domain-containing protein [Sphaerisporangium aureirubrum]|uniref:FG-GAP repeat domain-containing protein n=1 Tax=Sphaerisporangium aureirubrum TaxID=1544736 RepID=A0ABW1NFH9_9ACTN